MDFRRQHRHQLACVRSRNIVHQHDGVGTQDRARPSLADDFGQDLRGRRARPVTCLKRPRNQMETVALGDLVGLRADVPVRRPPERGCPYPECIEQLD
jgi:hypothetical protein